MLSKLNPSDTQNQKCNNVRLMSSQKYKKNRDYGIMYIFHYKGWLYNKIHRLKYLYDKIYTIGYYSGFYSSLRDKLWGNGCHFEVSSKDGEEW